MSKAKAKLSKSKPEEEYFESIANESGSEAEEVDDQEENEDQNDNEKNKKPIKIRTIVRKPQPKLDPMRLCGQRGLDCLLQTFEKFRSKGENHEFQDLNNMIAKYEYWSHRLFPKMKFVDIVERLEKLGEKREVKNKMNTLRMGNVNENGEEHDPAIEDEAMTAKVMEMMDRVNASESEESEKENDFEIERNKRNNKVIDENEEEDRIVSNNDKEKNVETTKKVVDDDEEDEDELFNRLLNEHNILKNF